VIRVGEGSSEREEAHVEDEIDHPVACRFRADEASTPMQSFPSQYAHELVPQLLIRPKHISNLPRARPNISGRDIGIRTNMPLQLCHERIAEPPNLTVRFAFGVKVGSALAAAHAQAGECILEGLLETEELEDRQVHGGVQAQSAFVRPQRRVELNAVPDVDVRVAGVIFPDDTELEDALRYLDDVERLFVFRFGGEEGAQTGGELVESLKKQGE
jgi:hypothetical protein